VRVWPAEQSGMLCFGLLRMTTRGRWEPSRSRNTFSGVPSEELHEAVLRIRLVATSILGLTGSREMS